MIELFLSSDGKHTVHVAADTPEQLARLAPSARSLYQKVLESYGTKAQMWQAVTGAKGNGEGRKLLLTPYLHRKPARFRPGAGLDINSRQVP